LLEDPVWSHTENIANKLHSDAVKTGRLCTDRFVSRQGLAVIVSVAPNPGDDHLFLGFPNGEYTSFFLKERRQFRILENWGDLDFVHWMFLWDATLHL